MNREILIVYAVLGSAAILFLINRVRSDLVMLVLIFMVTTVTGLFISNTATAVLIAPVAIDAAITVHAPPHAFAMTVAIACSAAYVTPVSSPVNMMVLEPGG